MFLQEHLVFQILGELKHADLLISFVVGKLGLCDDSVLDLLELSHLLRQVIIQTRVLLKLVFP